MTAFVDSSGLVKLYADEADHAAIREIRSPVVSAVARVEVPSALWRKVRAGEIPPDAARVLIDEFEADWHGTPEDDPRFAAVAVGSEVLERAARVTGVHGLRTFDAVHLASALTARMVAPELTKFAAFDVELRVAAAAEGFTLLP